MIRIAIADDQEENIKHLESIVKTYARENNAKIQIYTYTNSTFLLADVTEGRGFDIYLLDIEMPVENSRGIYKVSYKDIIKIEKDGKQNGQKNVRINAVEDKYVLLDDGTAAPVSRSRIKETREAVSEFFRRGSK